jgi:ABC-type sugar transport system ATPase subunit
MVFQRPTVYPHLSVRDNIAFGLHLQQTGIAFFHRSDDSSMQERVSEVARLLKLEDVLDRRADRLSGGQQQRVALGRAVARRPAVFLLDEPLSQLDLPLRLEMRRELHLLHRRLPATMIYVTHDPVEAMTLADRVAVLDAGALQQVDPPQVVYQRPANVRVARFFGEVPMNLLDGEIVQADTGPAFRKADGQVTVLLPREWAGQVRLQMPVTLGVRPEHLGPLTESGTIEGVKITRLPLEVVLAESAGAKELVTLRRGDLQLTALTDGTAKWADGQSVDVVMDMDRTHLFDGTTGQALAHGCRTG